MQNGKSWSPYRRSCVAMQVYGALGVWQVTCSAPLVSPL